MYLVYGYVQDGLLKDSSQSVSAPLLVAELTDSRLLCKHFVFY